MLQSKLGPVYFPNTIAKVSNSTVKSNTLVVFVFVCACACVFCGRTHFFFAEGGGAFNMSRPRGPWFLNPSMCVCVCLCLFFYALRGVCSAISRPSGACVFILSMCVCVCLCVCVCVCVCGCECVCVCV